MSATLSTDLTSAVTAVYKDSYILFASNPKNAGVWGQFINWEDPMTEGGGMNNGSSINIATFGDLDSTMVRCPLRRTCTSRPPPFPSWLCWKTTPSSIRLPARSWRSTASTRLTASCVAPSVAAARLTRRRPSTPRALRCSRRPRPAPCPTPS
jgi:hypothetical protein